LIDCGDPTPDNGERVDSGGTDFGSSATIECNTGYELIGSKVITCDDGGIWSDYPMCAIKGEQK
jgi:CUB/sushi domain-containing protein